MYHVETTERGGMLVQREESGDPSMFNLIPAGTCSSNGTTALAVWHTAPESREI